LLASIINPNSQLSLVRQIVVLLLILGACSHSLSVCAQQNTKVKGVVIDAQTKEPLPFVNIAFVGKNIGITTDFKGKYNLDSKWASGKISASFMGYKLIEKPVEIGGNQTINFELEPKSIQVDEVTVVAKGRYKNKENPAVALIKKVIANKDKNRPTGFDYYSYDKYEKLQLDLNNITEDFMNKKAFKKFGFMWNYVDTSAINGKPYLPLYLREKKSKVYYRKNPKGQKEIQYGLKTVGFEDFMDEEGLNYFLEKIYQDIDIYENSILLMEKQFKSPVGNIATSVYKFFILDTVDIDNKPYIKLAFQPRNSADVAFRGDMFIALDSSYAIKKIKMGITRNANINFVSALEIDQDFGYTDEKGWQLERDQLTIDYNFLNQKMGMYGKKTISYQDIKVNVPPPDSIVNWSSSFVSVIDPKAETDSFWVAERHEKLDDNEKGVYTMTKDLKELPAFKRAMNVMFLLISGYYSVGKFDIGPLYSLFSFNDVEGIRNRFSIRTNKKFSKKVALDAYVAYGWKDKNISRRFKGGFAATYFFSQRPYHQIDVEWQRDIRAPGASIRIATFDNVFVSFRRGIADLMLYHDTYRVKWTKEWNGSAIGVDLEHMRNVPAGALRFQPTDGSAELNGINSNDVTAWVRYSPNVRYYEGRSRRIPIKNKYPIYTLSYTYSLGDNFLGAKYDHHKISANIFKRFYMNPIGFGDMDISGGYIVGEVPFPLLFVHKGNQTFFFDPSAFNMMNLFEFVSDKYVSIFYDHHFNGAILNNIPLFKKLKWRTTLGLRAVYGGVSKSNNPNNDVNSDRIFEFPTRTVDAEQKTVTYTLDKGPYMEVSFGIENIFKLISIDVVKRLTHLDNPGVSKLGGLEGWGVRTRFAVRF
jgi:hypothetical protein